ncbi:V-type ATPase 116kDa subunit family protein [Microbispora sp. H10670]|uniref:V-type ATPase 116kDa subunit family protein n=1 Tax=Microbispora sp. H10670 TaxID=2729108 RepID=UPI001601DD5B|nr:V-type ATPase 116kDa subunit family protein [Microbispora sp. H10670]
MSSSDAGRPHTPRSNPADPRSAASNHAASNPAGPHPAGPRPAWRDALRPVRMERVAIVAPSRVLTNVLRRVGTAGTVELSTPADASLDTVAQAAVVRDEVAALAGWMPAPAVPELAGRLSALGGAVVVISRPRGVEAPSLLRPGGLRGSLSPVVSTYGTVPYRDIDPTPLAAGAYVVMFGMMFGDAGHGALLLVAAAVLYRAHRTGRPGALARFGRGWPFALGAGVTSILFGLAYGEFFGPTGLVPVLWLAPLARPGRLLLAALGVGVLLLGGAYALGVVNRWREGGWPVALYSSAGIAGAALFLGAGLAVAGWFAGLDLLALAGGSLAATGLILAFTGFLADAGGGPSGVAQAVMRLFDVVVRLGANLVSFARLAAFGLTHAAIGSIVWMGTTTLWAVRPVAAVVVFVVGNALAFAIEALVVGVQALRLEYYELFSRLFQAEGRPFRPWRLPPTSGEARSCPSGSGEACRP